jgi:hypothetical protein
VTITDFLRYVLPGISGVPSAVARQAVIEAAQEFLRETKVWDEIQDPIRLGDGVNEYDLEAPRGAKCIDLQDVYAHWAPDGRLRGMTQSQLARQSPEWATARGGLPVAYTRAADFQTIRVYPIPTEPQRDAVIRMHAVYTLSDDATELPEEIVSRWREALVHGARSRLLITSKDNPWRDLELGEYHRRQFRDGLQEAQIYAEHGKTRGEVIVPPIRFGG